jgi:hypothetical protein
VLGVPLRYFVSQNYPNPFNPVTNIDYEIPFDGYVSLKIYDNSGKEKFTLLNETKTSGYYRVQFDASNLSSGVYHYVFLANNKRVSVKNMVILK